MTVIIERIEFTKDSKNRNVVHLTTVFYADLDGELFKELVYKDNVDNDSVNINYEDENEREYEVTGTLVLQYLDELRKKGNSVDELWKEDGIGIDGRNFDINNRYYNVEIF